MTIKQILKSDSSTGNSAIFSPDERYRYLLWRRWGHPSRFAMWIGLNPSTADETQDDPTIRRCINFSKEWGMHQLVMVNLFAYRATDPRDMRAAVDPIGPENDKILLSMAERASLIVAAWGNGGSFRMRDEAVAHLLRKFPIACIGVNNSGAPKHPLYAKHSKAPEYFQGPAPVVI